MKKTLYFLVPKVFLEVAYYIQFGIYQLLC